ncbi:hypothetical protein FB45DRAFT_1119094 [Roridomyces roridus]|uniref:DUF6533 domain-containing protein n=1 Tax=Roridomyces roridus TaxID=1738132 RepID=A0AAD7B6Y2_9AGAR|nr:hypothetical protein FB45DRAFT_1119094 [Roridomyces roridus]
MDTPIDIQAFEHAQWERNCQLAAATIVVYEFFMHFPKEISLFWSRPKWTVAKCLFLFVRILFASSCQNLSPNSIQNRYYSLGYNLTDAVVFAQRDASAKAGPYTFHSPHSLMISATPVVGSFFGIAQQEINVCRCSDFFHWQNGGSALQHVLNQMILSLRLYAMYGRSKRILAFLVLLLAIELTGFIILLELPAPGLVATNNPSTDLFICADGDPPHGHWIAYVPVILLITEFIIFLLAVFKAWQQYRSEIPSGQILPKLMKESVWFFFAISLVHLGTVTTWMMNILTLDELWTGFSLSIPAVLANRLLISIREQADFTSDTVITTEQPTLEFHFSNTTTCANSFELMPVDQGQRGDI